MLVPWYLLSDYLLLGCLLLVMSCMLFIARCLLHVAWCLSLVACDSLPVICQLTRLGIGSISHVARLTPMLQSGIELVQMLTVFLKTLPISFPRPFLLLSFSFAPFLLASFLSFFLLSFAMDLSP